MSMKKAIAVLLSTGLGLALLVYSAARSLNFIMATLPADKQILAYFGLAALDGGLLLWLAYFLFAAGGAWQRGTALVMTVVDLIGAVAMFTLDTLYESGQTGLTVQLAPEEIKTAILALSGVIAINIAATVFCHIMDPGARSRRVKEEAREKITDKTLDKIDQSVDLLAEEISNQVAETWKAEILAEYSASLARSSNLIIPGELRDLPPAKPKEAGKLGKMINELRRNGNRPAQVRAYPAEVTAAGPLSEEELQ